jgi:hypothetical protein
MVEYTASDLRLNVWLRPDSDTFVFVVPARYHVTARMLVWRCRKCREAHDAGKPRVLKHFVGAAINIFVQ